MRNNHTGHILWEELLRVTDIGASFTSLLLGGPWVLPPPCCLLCTRIIKRLVCTHCTTAKSYKWSDIHFLKEANIFQDAQNSPFQFLCPARQDWSIYESTHIKHQQNPHKSDFECLRQANIRQQHTNLCSPRKSDCPCPWFYPLHKENHQCLNKASLSSDGLDLPPPRRHRVLPPPIFALCTKTIVNV
jgi:hypothetical protein